uniref:CID domain-containing protein n=1 Tax=Trichuris muris TaxID=70415 RepID=A0A5S6QJN1_TRIMR
MALTEEDVIAEYRSSLQELQFNSKPHINMLTMLAEESQQFAAQIVEVIEAHVHEVPSCQKLPVLYLVDSIVKNCPDSPYKDLFAKNIINTFVHVFDKVDERTRQSLFKLRQTWPDIFPASRLYRIDIKVHEIDPAWPLQEPSQLKATQNANPVLKSVHFNPRFIEQKPAAEAVPDKCAAQPVVPNATAEQVRHKELLRLQKELEMERRNMLGMQGEMPDREDDMRRVCSVNDAKLGQQPTAGPALQPPTDPRIRKRQIGNTNMRMQENVADVPSEKASWGERGTDERGDRDHWKSDREPLSRRCDRDFRPSRFDRRGFRGPRRSRDSDFAPRFKSSPPRSSRDRSPPRNHDSSPSRKRHRRFPDDHYPDNRVGPMEYDPFEKDGPGQRRSQFDVYPDSVRENQGRPVLSSFREEVPADRKMDIAVTEVHDPRLKSKRPFVTACRSVQPTDEEAKQKGGLEQLAGEAILATSAAATTTTVVSGNGVPLPGTTRISIDAPILPTSSADSIFEHRASIFQRAEQQLSDGMITSGEYNELIRDIGHVVGNAGLNVAASSADYSILTAEGGKPPHVGHTTMAGSGQCVAGAFPMDPALLARKATTVEVIADDASAAVPVNNRLYVDGLAYEVRFIDEVAVIERNGLPHRIYFVGHPHDVVIDGIPHPLSFSDPRPIIIDGQSHAVRFGAPSRELYIGNFPLRASFGGPPIFVNVNGVKHKIQLCGPPPEVKIDPEPAYELIRFMSSSHMAKRTAQDSLASESSRRAALLTPRQAQPAAGQPVVDPPPSQTNVTELLDKLLKSGIIGQQVPLVPQAVVAQVQGPPPLSFVAGWNQEEMAERRQTPTSDLKTFNVSFLKIRYKSVVDSLHQHKIQCSTCGMRFPVDDRLKYAKHLDWHFKMNRREKSARGALCRPWFLALEDVVNYEELGEDITTKVKSSVFEAIQKPSDKPVCGSVASTDSVVVASDVEQFCAVCEESFEQFFDQDEDAWKLRNATVVNGKTYHPLCYQDLAPSGEASSADADQQETSHPSLRSSWLPSAMKSERMDVKTEDAPSSVTSDQPVVGEQATNAKESSATVISDSSASCSSGSSLLQSILSVFCKVPASSSAAAVAALASSNSATQSVLASGNSGTQLPTQNSLSTGRRGADLPSLPFPVISGTECLPPPSVVATVTSSSFVASTAQTTNSSNSSSGSVANLTIKQEE